MRLVLLRHGIAVDPEDPACPPDEDRPLTRKGIRRARASVRGIRRLGVRVDTVLSSPLMRALQTARIAAQVMGLDEDRVERTAALAPGSPPEALLTELSRHKRAEAVLCAGHAPTLDIALAMVVTGRPEPFTELGKAGAACIDYDRARRRGVLLWLLSPADLRQIER